MIIRFLFLQKYVIFVYFSVFVIILHFLDSLFMLIMFHACI
jgi:hypothetical protein